MNRILNFVCAILVLIIISSCDRNIVYDCSNENILKYVNQFYPGIEKLKPTIDQGDFDPFKQSKVFRIWTAAMEPPYFFNIIIDKKGSINLYSSFETEIGILEKVEAQRKVFNASDYYKKIAHHFSEVIMDEKILMNENSFFDYIKNFIYIVAPEQQLLTEEKLNEMYPPDIVIKLKQRENRIGLPTYKEAGSSITLLFFTTRLSYIINRWELNIDKYGAINSIHYELFFNPRR